MTRSRTPSRTPIGSPAAWCAQEMQASRRWLVEFDAKDLRDIDDAYRHLQKSGNGIPFHAADFPLGRLARRLAEVQHEIEQGSGVTLLRGLDVDRYGVEGARLIYWGIGAHLGTALAQNPAGQLLVDVRDEGGDPYRQHTARGYHTAQYLPFHNDQGDVVGLLCLRTAKAGGVSCICSSAAIHDEILRTRPDLLDVLYGDFYADVRGEQPPGRRPYYIEPRYAIRDGRFYAQHGPTYIKSAQRFPEVPRLTEAQLEAMALIDALAGDDRFRLDMGFRQGDMQFLNNHLVLHSRTGFEDHDEPGRKRHLLRLWLRTPYYARVPDFFQPRFEDMAHWLAHPVASASRAA